MLTCLRLCVSSPEISSYFILQFFACILYLMLTLIFPCLQIESTSFMKKPQPVVKFVNYEFELHRADKPLNDNTVVFRLADLSLSKPEIKQYLTKSNRASIFLKIRSHNLHKNPLCRGWELIVLSILFLCYLSNFYEEENKHFYIFFFDEFITEL